MDHPERQEAGSEGSDNRSGESNLLGRKSVLMGLAASIGVALANAAQPSRAMAGTVKPIAATTPLYALNWSPSTAYALGQQVISPNNDVVTANVAFRSSTTFNSDQAKWTESSTFALRADYTQLAAAVAALQATTGTAPVGTPGPGMYNTLIYGPGVGFDTKANVVINRDESMAMRFKAGTTSAVTGVQWTQRTGPTGYSLGTGGTTTVSIQTDDGAGKPSGTRLGQSTISPGNPGAQEKFIVQALASSTLTAGTIYYVVFENPSATDYLSSNCAYSYDNHAGPKQPKFNDAEFGVLLTTSYGGAWSTTVNNAAGYTPVVDIVYANGYHDGNAYNENIGASGYYTSISGASLMARETFTVTGGTRSVSHASVRVRRQGGTAPLILTLETAAGAFIDSASIPAASVPITTPGGDNGGAVWVTANFGATRTLTNGVAYHLRLSTAAGTTYSTDPIRNMCETYYQFHSYDYTDGVPYKTVNGSTWTKMSNVASYSAESWDMQFYLS